MRNFAFPLATVGLVTALCSASAQFDSASFGAPPLEAGTGIPPTPLGVSSEDVTLTWGTALASALILNTEFSAQVKFRPDSQNPQLNAAFTVKYDNVAVTVSSLNSTIGNGGNGYTATFVFSAQWDFKIADLGAQSGGQYNEQTVDLRTLTPLTAPNNVNWVLNSFSTTLNTYGGLVEDDTYTITLVGQATAPTIGGDKGGTFLKDIQYLQGDVLVVPEPAHIGLVAGLGLVILAGVRRYRS